MTKRILVILAVVAMVVALAVPVVAASFDWPMREVDGQTVPLAPGMPAIFPFVR